MTAPNKSQSPGVLSWWKVIGDVLRENNWLKLQLQAIQLKILKVPLYQ